MKGLAMRWLLNAAALLITAWLVPGMQIKGFAAALIAALVLGVVNAIIRPIIIFFTLPLNILTLGLFTLVINAFMLLIVNSVVSGFVVSGFWAAFFGSIVLSIASGLLSMIILDPTGKYR